MNDLGIDNKACLLLSGLEDYQSIIYESIFHKIDEILLEIIYYKLLINVKVLLAKFIILCKCNQLQLHLDGIIIIEIQSDTFKFCLVFDERFEFTAYWK